MVYRHDGRRSVRYLILQAIEVVLIVVLFAAMLIGLYNMIDFFL